MSEILQHPAYGGEKPAHQVIAELRQEVERWTQMHYDEMQRHTETSVKLSTAEAQLAAEREAVKVLAAAFGTSQKLVGYDNFAGSRGLDLVDAKRYLDMMTSANYMHHSRAAICYIGKVLAWMNNSAKAMNDARKAVRANPIAAAAVKENQPTQHTPNQGA